MVILQQTGIICLQLNEGKHRGELHVMIAHSDGPAADLSACVLLPSGVCRDFME